MRVVLLVLVVFDGAGGAGNAVGAGSASGVGWCG